ncbi:MAG: hypothetical protein R6V25_03710 [Desulfatiglandales bacterium]
MKSRSQVLRFLNEDAGIKALHPAFKTMGIRANAQGEFAIGLSKAGWWGIAVPDVADLDYKGKELVQEAVLWIQVTDIP